MVFGPKPRASGIWLPLLFSALLVCCSAQSVDEQTALAEFFKGVSSKHTWDTSAPLCGQEGIICEDGSVTQLLLGDFFSSGTISTHLGQLSHLRDLILGENNLGGVIPTELGQLQSLEKMNLQYTLISGTLPTELGQLANLKELRIGYASLNGTIPTELGQLKALNLLELNRNSLSGTVPTELGQLTGLGSLNLQDNSLTGAIPTELGQLANLGSMILAQNQLTSTIPTEFGLLEKVTSLGLSDNRLSGAIPTEIGRMLFLNLLLLKSNALEGTLPTQLGQLQFLQELTAPGNSLTGTIPTELGKMGFTQGKKIAGQTPVSSTSYIDLSSNSLTGTIPTELGLLANLRHIYLQDNRLFGTVPTQLESLPLLGFLFLGGTNHYCPLVHYSSWAQHTDSPSNLTCDACGASFPLCPSGETCLGGVNETFSCQNTKCQGRTEGNAQWPLANALQTVTGVCQAGFSGNPTRLCNANGVYQAIQNPCTVNQCQAVEEGNVAWALTNALTTVNGTCQTGYRGSPSRTCDASGTWSAVVSPCTLIQCGSELAGFASWPLTNASATATGTCRSNYTGTPTRTCSAAGLWLAIQAPCTPPADAASLPVVQATLRLTNLDFQWFSSSEQNAQAFLSALIAYFAQLLGVPESSIVIVSVTKGSVVVKFDVRTADPDAGKAKLEDFIDSPTLSFLSDLPDEAKEDPSQGVGLDKAASGAQVAMPDPTEAPRKKSNAGAIAGGVIGGLIGLALIGAIAFFVAKKMRAGGSDDHELNKVSSSSR